jgi:hypothetical protein
MADGEEYVVTRDDLVHAVTTEIAALAAHEGLGSRDWRGP